ncbi:ABC transporter permease [Spirosoma fluviale]|uniref:Duplicated orphan permease n=1 Tax=Spirosoma fluviale TaxID=1597977 RepID=A0A286G2K0_9BACT|nr:ABC transporter permease [Spirosoma fluviale]SOD89214.1 duplicated orphan permease [Spirosoma fluviale]
MFRNYVKIAFRSLMKNKLYSSINVFGLALGMACSLLIGLWVKDELSYNRFLNNAESIHYVRVNFPYNGETVTNTVTPGPLQEAIAKDVPEVAATTKINFSNEVLVKVGETTAKEKGHYATADFFGVFDLPALYGNPKAALAQPNQIVITRKLAEKFFPNGLALGKTLQLDNNKFYVVGAILENLPTNSTLQFDWLVNWKAYEQDWMKTWGNNSFQTFVRLKPNRIGGPTTLAQAEAAMATIYPRTAGKNFETGRPVLQPITDLHLYSDYKNGVSVGGRIEYVRIFSIVALFMLLIACINFMNLATAQSAMRAKEVGVRKVVGALRSSLIGQFLSESMLMSLLAIVLAVGLVWCVLPTFNTTFEKQLTLDLTEPALWLTILGLVLITGFLSGSYPALFLSSLQPIKIMKGKIQLSSGSAFSSPALFRRVLVVFQFSLSIFLIVGILAIGRQMNYLRTKNLGLDRENIVYLPLEGEIAQPKKVEAFRQEVMRQPAIASATTAMSLPVNVQSTSGDLKWDGKDPNLQTNVSCMFVGGDFTKTMNIKLVDGRDFRTDSPADSTNYLINEAAARLMAMKDPVGKNVQFWPGKGKIIGLMKDFHLNSLHQTIAPLILCFDSRNTSYLLVKTHAGQAPNAIAELEKLSKQFNPNYPFTYHFLDEEFESLYRAEQQVHILVNYFGMLAILISCLGLFALAAFTAEQRTKEIGVRKVLGASVTNIVGLLSKDFLKLVLIALVLSTPLAWWALSKWLETFAYREDLTWWIFGIAGVLAVLIAFLTVSYQSIKAAMMNPVKSLRTE